MLITGKKRLIPDFIRKLRKSQKGTILIEFAFVFPVVLLLLLGGFETFRLLMANRKSSMTVTSVSNLVSQNKTLTSGAIKNIFDAVDNIMKPLSLGTDGQIFVSYVTGTSGGNIIELQCKGTTNTTLTSKIGTAGGQANLAVIPGQFTLAPKETVVISEIIYHYQPVFIALGNLFSTGMFTTHDIYQVAVEKPRYKTITFTNGCP
ncbi:MAG: hypothetical protein GXP02_08410 [Alphaproteobacteria bacterium]|nr:hypothetical protein [Alphaproteobacteria bacterium]